MFENIKKEIRNSNKKSSNIISNNKISNYVTDNYKNNDITQINKVNKLDIINANDKIEGEENLIDKTKYKRQLSQNSKKSSSNQVSSKIKRNTKEIKMHNNIFNINQKCFNNLIKKEKTSKINKNINNFNKSKENKPIILNILKKEESINPLTSSLPIFPNSHRKGNNLQRLDVFPKDNNKKILKTSDAIFNKKIGEKIYNEKSKNSKHSSQNSIFNKSRHSTEKIYQKSKESL